MTWEPERTPHTMTLLVPASIRGHAREILMKTLPPALEQLAGDRIGDKLSFEVRAAEEVELSDGSVAVKPGQVLITAERLTEMFDADALRLRLDALATEAVREGNAWAAEDTERMQTFLEELVGGD
jgi:hypothetical protein